MLNGILIFGHASRILASLITGGECTIRLNGIVGLEENLLNIASAMKTKLASEANCYSRIGCCWLFV